MGLTVQPALLSALAGTVGLGRAGWAVGLSTAGLVTGALSYALHRRGGLPLGPADRVTLARAVLVCAVAALVADALTDSTSTVALVALASVALLLDGVDGWVARWSGTVSSLGARFDMEVDALLILVLSLCLVPTAGPYVLLIGSARYALGAATWAVPWLGVPTPPRYWRKVVAATQGIVLTVGVAGVLPMGWTQVLLLSALLLLAASFGTQVFELRSQRAVQPRLLAVLDA